MSTGVSDHQRNKGQGSSGNQSYGKSNSSKDHHAAGDHEEVDSWRNQQGHHQGYGSSMGTDSYNMPAYYGSFQQYPPNHSYGVNEAGGGGGGGGPWSNNGGNDMFVGGGGYSSGGMHESGGGGHYNVEGMFSGGNGGSFGNFGGGQPNCGGYGSFGNNGDYSAWGPQQPRKQHYDDYYSRDGGMYGDERGMKMLEHGMGGLGMGSDKEMKEFKELMNMQGGGGSKKTTWASIASQPAKPQSISKKSKPGMPLPPMIPGAWESKNGVAKTPISAPVQAPAWERPKIPSPVQQPPVHAVQPPVPSQPMSLPPNIPPTRGFQIQHQPPPMSYNMPPQQSHQHQHQPNSSTLQNSHSQNSHSQSHSNGNHHVAAPVSPPGPKYPDEMKMKDYNPPTFDLMAEGARFFVIKSYSEDDIHRSIKYEIWCSTEHGNKRLDEAYKEREACKGVIYLLFSVNGSGHFCGMAQMISSVDYHAKASVWSQDKWKGQFKVKWVYVKDVPNAALRHIRLENNENKPVTNSRDTQEVPFEKGKQVLKIIHSYHHTTSIFDDFIHYEKRQEEEDQRKTVVQPPPPPPLQNNIRGGERGGGRAGFHDRGGFRGGSHHNHPGQRGEMDGRNEHNSRDFRDRGGDHRGGRDGGYNTNPRNEQRDSMDFRDRPERDHYNPRDRDDRGDRETRDRDQRGGHRGGSRPPMMRNYEK